MNSKVLGAKNEALPLESKGVHVSFPQMVFISILLLISVFPFSVLIADLSLLYLQVALILGPLLRFSYLHHHSGDTELPIDWWQASPYLMLIGVSGIGWYFGVSTSWTSFSQIVLPVCFYLTTLCLLAGYGIWMWQRVQLVRFTMPSSGVNIMVIVTTAFIVMTPVVVLKLSEIFFMGLRDSYAIGKTIYIVGFLVSLMLVWVLFGFLRASVNEKENQNGMGISPDYQSTMHSGFTVAKVNGKDSDPELIHLASEIEAVLTDPDWIVNPSLSLDSMEAKTTIAKSRLSQVFNTYYRKGFYQMIGEYRIRYAMTVLEENSHISFEALSEMCGFNSKSTFYKYFKKVNGCTPNEYLQSHKLKVNGIEKGAK